MEKEKYYMNLHTGAVDTADGWGGDFRVPLIEVAKDENGDWIEAE